MLAKISTCRQFNLVLFEKKWDHLTEPVTVNEIQMTVYVPILRNRYFQIALFSYLRVEYTRKATWVLMKYDKDAT